MKNLFSFLMLFFISIAGCGTYSKYPVSDENRKIKSDKLDVEAYLFDARYYDEGAPRSFRLQLFDNDNQIAMTGKGYLGKGVLKGVITRDSIKVHFPAIEEFYYESVDKLLNYALCDDKIEPVDIFTLFQSGGEMELNHHFFSVNSILKNDKKKVEIIPVNCDWLLLVEFKEFDSGWKLYSFTYSEKNKEIITGTLREFKESASVKSDRFVMPGKPKSLKEPYLHQTIIK